MGLRQKVPFRSVDDEDKGSVVRKSARFFTNIRRSEVKDVWQYKKDWL
jgi:hypothetical protein